MFLSLLSNTVDWVQLKLPGHKWMTWCYTWCYLNLESMLQCKNWCLHLRFFGYNVAMQRGFSHQMLRKRLRKLFTKWILSLLYYKPLCINQRPVTADLSNRQENGNNISVSSRYCGIHTVFQNVINLHSLLRFRQMLHKVILQSFVMYWAVLLKQHKSFSKSVIWSQPNKARFSVTEDQTEGKRPRNGQQLNVAVVKSWQSISKNEIQRLLMSVCYRGASDTL